MKVRTREEKIELARVSRKEELPVEDGVLRIMGRLIIPIILIPILITGFMTVRRYLNFVPQYKAIQTVLINRKGDTAPGKDGAKMLQDAVYSYADLSKTSMVLQKVKEKVNTDLDISGLKLALDAVPRPLSQMVDLGITTDSEKLSLDLSGAVAAALKEVGAEVRGEDLVTIIDVPEKAVPTGSRISVMDIIKNFIKYLAVTVTLAFIYSVLREIFRSRRVKKAGRK